jgi:hypothetical protein
MYVPFWLLIVAAIFLFFLFKKPKEEKTQSYGDNVEGIEDHVSTLKDNIFKLEHFDSPHFLDYQMAYEAMELNYFKLKARSGNDPAKKLEVASDWLNYVQALCSLKTAWLILDVDLSEKLLKILRKTLKNRLSSRQRSRKNFVSY